MNSSTYADYQDSSRDLNIFLKSPDKSLGYQWDSMINLAKLFLGAWVIIVTQFAFAESLSYSGRLVNLNGSPVTGTPDLKFELAYSGSTGTIKCTDDVLNVPLTNGVFHAKLDFDCSLSSKTLNEILSQVPIGQSVVIRVTNVDASKIYSFQDLHSLPLAKVSEIAKQLDQNSATAGQILSWDGSKWAPINPPAAGGGGSVTSITAGSGLSGGTITSTGTIAIAAGGVTDSHLATGISRAKIAGGTPNYVVMNDASGVLTEVAQLPLAQGGTGANTAAGARTNLGLGSAATAALGYAVGNALPADNIPVCLAGFKLQFTGVGPLYWGCASDDSVDASKLPLIGGTMSGAIAMGNNKITGLATPTVATDAVTMGYVDSKVAAAPGDNLGNHTATTNLAMGTNNITGVGKIFIADGAWNSPSITFTSSPSTGLFHNGGILGFSANGSLAMNLSSSTLSLNGSFAPYMRLGGGTNGATGPTYSFGGDTDTGMFNLSTNILGFTTGGVEKMRILETGEMAIGKTTAAGKLDVAGDIATDGKLRLKSDNTNFVELRAPASLAATTTYTFPASAGTSGYALITNGAGVLSWSAVATTASTVGGDLSGTIANAQIVANGVGTAEIADTAVTYAKLNLADDDIPLAKVNGLVSALSGKEPTITAGTTAQYWRGDKSWQTLITTAVPEGTNLYFTQPRVLASIMSGYSTGTALPINTTDTVNQAFGKLEAQIIANKTAEDNKWDKNGTSVYYNDGNVGIGTNVPSTALTVVGTTTTTSLAAGTTSTNQLAVDGTVAAFTNASIRNRAADGVSGVLYTDHAGNGKGFVGHINASAAAPYPAGTLSLMGVGVPVTLGVGGYEAVRILDTNGYMGIGTATPGSRLEVDGSIRNSRATDNSTGRNLSWQVGTDTNNASNSFANGDPLLMLDGGLNSGTNTLRIFGNSGRTLNVDVNDGSLFVANRVGVGTTTPATLVSNINAADSFNNVGDSNTTGQNSQSLSWKSNDAGYTAALINTSALAGANGLQVRTASTNANILTLGTGVATAANPDVMTVKANGKVGIGTNNPSGHLSIQSATDAIMVNYGGDAYQAGLSLGSSLNNRWLMYRNTAATGRYMAIWRDLSGVGGPAGSNVMTFLPSGYIGINNDAPGAHLDVNGYSATPGVGVARLRNSYNSGGTRYWQLGPDGNGNGNFVVYNEGLAGAYIVHGQTTWSSSSDKRLKKHIKPIENALEKVQQLNGVTYQYKKDKASDPRKAGVLAQDLKKVLPEAVTESDGYLSVKYTEIIPLLIESIKGLYKENKREIASVKVETDLRIKKLEAENAELKKKNDEMNLRLDRLEKALHSKKP